jgi:hypothetical protein
MKKTTRMFIDEVERSRRVAWAVAFEKRDEAQDLKDQNDYLKWLVRLLIRRIVFHKRLNNDDDLVQLAKELELAI